MTIDEAYRSAFAGVNVPRALIQKTRQEMDCARGAGAKPQRRIYRCAAVCLAAVLAVSVGIPRLMKLYSSGPTLQKSTAASGTHLTNGTEASAASENTVMALEGAASGASSAPSGSPSGSGSMAGGSASHRLEPPVYRIYGGGFYRAAPGTLGRSNLGEKLSGEGYGACYAIKNIPVSQSIAFDYTIETDSMTDLYIPRYDYLMSSVVEYGGASYEMEDNSGPGLKGAPTVGEKLGEYDGMPLYRAAEATDKIWVDVLPKLNPEGTQPGDDRTLYLAGIVK